jgi:hypothetical protein
MSLQRKEMEIIAIYTRTRNFLFNVNSFKHEIHVFNIYKFSSYLKENAMHLHDNDQLVNAD